MINSPRNTRFARHLIFPDKAAHEFAFERRDHPWQASVFIRNVATFVDRNRSHRWKMRLKSNSPAQPSGGNEGDGDAQGFQRGTAPFELRVDDEILIFLADGALAPPRFVFVYLILNHDVATLATLRRLFHRNFLLPPISRGELCEKTLLYEISCFFHRLLARRYFPVFWRDRNPKEFCRSKRFNKRGIENFMLEFYDMNLYITKLVALNVLYRGLN